jgi:aryl-alcohol dehydrogenase-like predicted oxidoreductase
MAELRGCERLAGLQLEYSLAERNIEFEYVPLALNTGIGICPWSPLASGLLSGKYQRGGANVPSGEGRLTAVKDSGNPSFLKLFTERNWKIVDTLLDVARQIGRPPAQVALNWVANRPGVSSTLIGATKVAQLNDNIGALELQLPDEIQRTLDEASRPETLYPYHFFESTMQQMVTGGTRVRSYAAS